MAHEDAETNERVWQSAFSKIAVGLAVLVAAFLAGHIPSSLRADRLEDENRRLEHHLSLAQLLGYLGMASYEVQRSNYASAAEYSTEFFNRVREEIGTAGDAPPTQALETILGRRDEIAADLGAANPAVKEKVAAMYADLFRVAMQP